MAGRSGMRSVDRRFDVTDAAALGTTQAVAGSLLQPDGAPTALLVCVHGGTYDRRYWRFELDGHPGYSMADHLVQRGFALLLLDTLGMGESTRPPTVQHLTPNVAAAANDAVVRQIRTEFTGVPVVGIGHSMGGMLALTQQSRHRSFDALGVLGWSADDLNLRPDADHFLVDGDYRIINRGALRNLFYWEDVPEAVIEADDAAVVPTPRSLEDACFVAGCTSEHAARIDVPVFVGLGERDVSADPHREPAMYSSATDITLYVLARSGHCHNFASTRARLWDRLGAWSAEGARAARAV